MKLNNEVVGVFVDWCCHRGLEPAETASFLHSQDWHPADEGITTFTDAQMAAINSKLSALGDNPSIELMGSAVRAVMAASSN
jgi:hypothetical protein